MRWMTTLLLACPLAACLLVGCGGGDASDGTSDAAKPSGDAGAEKPRLAFVTNGVASFWVIAQKGAEDGGADFDADVSVHMPTGGATDQKQILEDLMVKQVDGIAVSPIDPDNQTDLLDQVAQRTTLITHDSDAPDSDRLCYIGMDNYIAGRLCGELVKEALPDGGEVFIFVGRLEQENAKLRRQGVIDELLDRDHDATRYDPPDVGTLSNGKYTILGTLTDQFDRVKGKENAEDAISRHPELDCMVGLFAYNPPLCLTALEQAGKLGTIKLVAFDEADETLQGIVDGHVHGTVVQDPYNYGYQSMKMLAALARGEESVIPASGVMDIPARQIRRDNVESFWADLREKLGDTSTEGE